MVFQVLDQKKVTPKEIAENKVSYSEMLRQQEARTLRTVLLQRLRKTSKVDFNQTLLQQPKTQQAGL